jgi:hypothetical protein
MADRIDAGQRVVAIRDLDTLSAEAAARALLARVQKMRPAITFGALEERRDGRVFRVNATGANGRVDVDIVLVGAVDDAALRALGVATWAIDDYLLRLVLDLDAYSAFAASERYAEQDHARVVAKASELRNLFAANGIALRSSKRYLHLLRGVIDFRGAPATFAQLLVARASSVARPKLDPVLSPLLEDLASTTADHA